jgi:tetratricopeptide (TPR) repeat protein
VSNPDPKHDARWDAVEEAAELLREGDREAAMRELRAVLDRDPENPYAHYFLAAAHFEAGDFEAARQAYEAALAHAPAYLGAVVGLGHALRMLGRHAEAIRAGERALAMSHEPQGDPDAHFLLGLTYAARGDKAKALRHVEAFLASNPEVEARYEAEALRQTLQGKAKPLDEA